MATGPMYNPLDPATHADPYPAYRRLREAGALQFNHYAGIWFAGCHKHCLKLLRDPRMSAERGQQIRRRDDPLPKTMLTTDPPEHERLRRPVSRALRQQRIDRVRPIVRATVDQLLARAAGQRTIDVVAEFAQPLVTRILGDVMGVRDADLDRFAEWTKAASINLDPLTSPQLVQRGLVATEALGRLFEGLVAIRRMSPGDDFVSALVHDTHQSDILSTEEIVSACSLLTVGGHDPMLHLIGNGLYRLLQDPAAREQLRDDPSLIASAVEELLRFDTPMQFAARTAVDDIEVDGHIIRAGQAVVMLFGSANRDPEVFADPDNLHIERSPNPHLAFGAGVHLCMGAQLTRIVGQVAVGAFVQNYPKARLADKPVEWLASSVPRGLKALPVLV
jgi:cytochrome P450